jgi:hypothetical protein
MPQDQNLWIKKLSNTNKLILVIINNRRGTSGRTGFPIKSSEVTIKDIVERLWKG